MKYFLTLLCIIVISLSSFSQEILGHIITNKGEKINLYKNVENKVEGRMYHILSGDMNLTGQYVRYYDEKNELNKFPQSKVEKLVYGNKRYITLPTNKKRRDRVHEVIAENEKYLLTEFYAGGWYNIYVFDKTDDFEPKIERWNHSGSKESDFDLIEMLKPYFPDCADLFNKMKQNIESAKTYEAKQGREVYHRYETERGKHGYAIPNKILSSGINNFICK